MPRPTVIERARRYVAVMPAAVSGSNGHNATYAVACALVKGFSLSTDQARPLLQEFNQRCVPPWSDRELEHKLRQADSTSDAEPRGYLLGRGSQELGEAAPPRPAFKPLPKPEYDPAELKRFSGAWAQTVDLVWLANRSTVDPATVSAESFLSALYAPGENVVIFDNDKSQGQAVWPAEKPPLRGPRGVWFLAQPVDGLQHPNPRTGKLSRRSEESVIDWRYLVLESDAAPAREWLGVLAQLPLRIAAIYSSGGRSVHALVRVDARTKGHWDEQKARWFGKDAPAGRFLMRNGLDPGVLSAVRLSRLPGCYREEQQQWQKLLYLCPAPRLQPLVDLLPKRDVEEVWLAHARSVSDADETGGAWIKSGLRYYARVSPRLREALTSLMEAQRDE